VNIAGLNNLALTAKPQAAAKGGKASKEKETSEKSSSFGDVLGQTQPQSSQAQSNRQAPAQNEKEKRSDDLSEPQVDADSMPSSQIPSSPTMGDRWSPSPNQQVGVPTAPGKTLNNAAANSPDEKQVDALTRRVVWNDFLRKMKEDLGVSAEDVLKAFSSLSTEDLAKPPMQNVDKIVMALGLNDQQAMMARQYFNELIQKTQSRSLGEELQTSGKQIGLTLMTQREAQLKAQQAGVERMNENFFLKGPYARPAVEKSASPVSDRLNGLQGEVPNGNNPALAMTPDLSEGALAQTPPPRTPGMTEPTLGQRPQMSEEEDSSPVGAAPAPSARAATKPAVAGQTSKFDAMTAKMQPVAPSTPSDRSIDQLVQKFTSNQAQSSQSASAARAKAQALQAMAAAPAAAAASTAAPTVTAPMAAAPMSAHSLNDLLATLKDGDTGSDDKDGSGADASYLNTPLTNAESKLNQPIHTGQDFQAQLQQVKPDAPMTVPDLVQQAQVMVRGGGGEMKVTMHPDGLGEVAMKVNVENGKVNVQMITESDEAKKLIERQLSDLKSSLTQNHLQVSDIKVDTATNLGKQLEQQYHDAQRQSTQAQWEQFRQDSQGWRRSFFDIPTAKPFNGQGDAPRDVSAPTSNNSYSAKSRSNASRRLDLVA
jgi:flagellar hook-length control protein FliK